MSKRWWLTGGLCLSALAASEVFATTVTFQPGAEGKDTWIWDIENISHADWGELRANQLPVNDQRILIEFDISSIPSGAAITSATLGLYRYGAFSGGGTIVLDAHQITSPWAESVTYSTRPTFDAGIESSATMSGTASGWYTWDLSSLVQDWVSGTANHGVGIYDHGNAFFQRFVSSDNAAATEPSFALPPRGAEFRPYLTVVYDSAAVPDAGTSLGLLSLGIASLGLVRRKLVR